MRITAEQCVEHLRDFLSNRPDAIYSQEFVNWHADVVGIVRAYDTAAAVSLEFQMPLIADIDGPLTMGRRDSAIHQFSAAARSLYTQLRLQTNSFQTAQVAQGAVHDYFEEIRQIVAGATRDILFLDAYLDPSFVGRYMPQIPAGVNVRLLTTQGKGGALKAACALYTQQHGTAMKSARCRTSLSMTATSSLTVVTSISPAPHSRTVEGTRQRQSIK